MKRPTDYNCSRSRRHPLLLFPAFLLLTATAFAQTKNPVIEGIVQEATNNSQLKNLAYELVDVIGPRLVGSPQMKQAHDWAVAKYGSWGIGARNEKWGEWRGWQRGVSHIDLVHPRTKTLEGMQLAWSPSTGGKTVTAETILIPDLADSLAFDRWLPGVKGKFVLISMQQPTGRPDYNWEEFGTKESFDRMKKSRTAQTEAWRNRIAKTGFTARTLPVALEKAGAAGVIMSNWSNGFGVNKIFSAYTKTIPTVDIALEDYGLLYRLTEGGQKPRIALRADSKEGGVVPTFNTIAEIRGTEKPEEYVMLSAHFDSWDGASGATDNGTGTITMMEAMRILKKIYPNPKRTILVGHWGSEEQGLNGWNNRNGNLRNSDTTGRWNNRMGGDSTGRMMGDSTYGTMNNNAVMDTTAQASGTWNNTSATTDTSGIRGTSTLGTTTGTVGTTGTTGTTGTEGTKVKIKTETADGKETKTKIKDGKVVKNKTKGKDQ